MSETRISIGDRVVIKARSSPDWAFVDGWKGRFIGYVSGYPDIACMNAEGVLCHFYVPFEHLDLLSGPDSADIPLFPAL